MSFQPITLPVFSQLLEPQGIAPAQDFEETGNLVCNQTPPIETRAKIRYITRELVRFTASSDEEVHRLMKHWRAELSPEIGNTEEEVFVSGFEDDEELKDLASEAPIIRLVNHLFARALDLNASDIHFEPNESYLDVRCRVDGIMARIVTLEDALPLRRYDEEGEVRFQFLDEFCDWNNGSWAFSASPEVSTIDRIADSGADIRITPDTFASILFGHYSASEAQQAGLLTVLNQDALKDWDRIFRTRYAPYEAEHTW